MFNTQYTERGLFTDYYELTMAQGYFDAGKTYEQATFEYFYRKNPFGGGYTIVCGIYDLIKFLKNFRFDKTDIEYLRTKKEFSEEFLDHLAEVRFQGEVRGLPEGSITFSYVPIMQITGPLGIIQLVETAVLNIVNFQSLVATKASRIAQATKRKNTVLEFGLRRSHSDAGITGARAAIIGGCVATSNTIAGKIYGLPVAGTQAHSWIQSFDTELDSFRAYAKAFPKNTVLLVDTYNTINEGIPNAIQVGREMREQGEDLKGIRLDSGDLAWFAIKSAEMLDEAGFTETKIVLSGGMDEYIVESIVNQIRTSVTEEKGYEAAEKVIDRLLYGIGTSLITGEGKKTSALDGVYKLVQVDSEAVIKISDNRDKISNPGRKILWRMKDTEGNWIADVMGLEDEKSPKKGDMIYHHQDFTKKYKLEEVKAVPLYTDLMELYDNKTEVEVWKESKTRVDQEFAEMDISHLRFLNPHIYKVSLTEKLYEMKNAFIHAHEH